MVARFVYVLACVALAHSFPALQPTPEELAVKITGISSNFKEYDYEEILKELQKEDREQEEMEDTTATEYTEEPIKDETENDQVSTEDGKSDSTSAKNENKGVGEEHKLSENPRVKRDVEDRTDIETVVAVKNNKIGTEKKYYFKTIDRNVKGQKFRCKIGLTSGDTIFYYRCLLISDGITSEVLQETGQTDLFDIA